MSLPEHTVASLAAEEKVKWPLTSKGCHGARSRYGCSIVCVYIDIYVLKRKYVCVYMTFA